jgi:putative membrane protein
LRGGASSGECGRTRESREVALGLSLAASGRNSLETTMKIKTLALSTVLAVSGLAHADDAKMKPEAGDMKPGASTLTEAEIKTIASQHHLNMMEIDTAKLAAKNGKSTAVKDYSKMVISDHEKADKDVTALAKKKGINKMPKVTMTNEEKQMHEESMATMAKLKKAKGAEFDRMFLMTMVQDHERAIAKLDMQMAEAQDPDLKKLLEDTRPVLQRHEDKARELQKQMESTSSLDRIQQP